MTKFKKGDDSKSINAKFLVPTLENSLILIDIHVKFPEYVLNRPILNRTIKCEESISDYIPPQMIILNTVIP